MSPSFPWGTREAQLPPCCGSPDTMCPILPPYFDKWPWPSGEWKDPRWPLSKSLLKALSTAQGNSAGWGEDPKGLHYVSSLRTSSTDRTGKGGMRRELYLWKWAGGAVHLPALGHDVPVSQKWHVIMLHRTKYSHLPHPRDIARLNTLWILPISDSGSDVMVIKGLTLGRPRICYFLHVRVSFKLFQNKKVLHLGMPVVPTVGLAYHWGREVGKWRLAWVISQEKSNNK